MIRDEVSGEEGRGRRPQAQKVPLRPVDFISRTEGSVEANYED